MKKGTILIFSIFFISLVGAGVVYDNPNLPHVSSPEKPTISFNNNSGMVNSSVYADFWDLLDTPADIFYDDLGGGNAVIANLNVTGIADFVHSPELRIGTNGNIGGDNNEIKWYSLSGLIVASLIWNNGIITYSDNDGWWQFSSDVLIDSTQKVYFRDLENYIYSSAVDTLYFQTDANDDGTGTINFHNDIYNFDNSAGDAGGMTMNFEGDGDFAGTLEANGLLTADSKLLVDGTAPDVFKIRKNIGGATVVNVDSSTQHTIFNTTIEGIENATLKHLYLDENLTYTFENNTGTAQEHCIDFTTTNQSGTPTGWKICSSYSGSNSIDLAIEGYGPYYNALQLDYVDFTNEVEFDQGNAIYLDDSDYSEYIVSDADNTLDLYSQNVISMNTKYFKLPQAAAAPGSCTIGREGYGYYDTTVKKAQICNSSTWVDWSM